MSKTRKWLLFGCGAVVVALAVGVPVWRYNHRTDVMLRRELARIKAEGSPVTLVDIAGKDIPDAINGAPEYHKAVMLVSTKEAYTDIGYTIGEAFTYKQPGEPKVDWDRFRLTLAKYENAIELAEEAQRKPRCRFALDWSLGPYGVVFEDAAKLRSLCRAINGKAMLCARDGKPAEALRTALVACKMDGALQDPPLIVYNLVRYSFLAITCYTIRDILTHGDVPEQDAMRLCDYLATIDLSSGFQRGLKIERAMGICGCNMVREAGPDYYYPGDTRREVAAKFYRECDEDELYYLTTTRAQIDVSTMSYRDAVLQKRDIGEPTGAPIGAKISADIPAVGRFMDARDRSQSEINGSRIALALAIYHGRHKSYPASLNDVSSILRGKVPLDPFAAKPFVYRRQGNGYLLYSIGPNLKDDGGRRSSSDEGDLVWAVK